MKRGVEVRKEDFIAAFHEEFEAPGWNYRAENIWKFIAEIKKQRRVATALNMLAVCKARGDRKSGRVSKLPWDEIKGFRAANWSFSMLAGTFGVTEAYLKVACKKRGIL